MDSFTSTSYGGPFSASNPHDSAQVQGFYGPPPPDEVPPPPPVEAPPPPPDIAPPPPLSPRSRRRDKARRTVSVQDVPPSVGTEEVLYSAFAQFGKVDEVYIARSHLESNRNPECTGMALVTLETEEQAKKVVLETTEKLYMVGGMPRPIISCIADEKQLELQDDPDEEPAPLPVKVLEAASDTLEVEFAAKWRQLHRRQQAEQTALRKVITCSWSMSLSICCGTDRVTCPSELVVIAVHRLLKPDMLLKLLCLPSVNEIGILDSCLESCNDQIELNP
jgi:hypothetical protein